MFRFRFRSRSSSISRDQLLGGLPTAQPVGHFINIGVYVPVWGSSHLEMAQRGRLPAPGRLLCRAS